MGKKEPGGKKKKEKHKGHSKHQCALFAGGDGIDEVAELSQSAKYICLKCGRVARKSKNVCKSQKL